jgi:hypothetical protein
MPTRLEVAAELRLGEKSTRQPQDLVCLTQLAHFLLKRFDALPFGGGRAWTLAGITLLLAYPAAHRLWRAADLGRDRPDRCPLRLVLPAGFADHAHGALDDCEGIFGLLLHDSILLNNGASTKSGAIHNTFRFGCALSRIRIARISNADELNYGTGLPITRFL